MAFASFMASPAGRIIRAVAGLALIGAGLATYLGAGNFVIGLVLVIVGMIPLAAALADACLFSPLFGAPLSGPKIRARQRARV